MKNLCFFICLILISCARPSEDRDSLDNYAGYGDNGLSSIQVQDGNAAIREFNNNSITIWVTAPVIQFELTVHANQVGTWQLEFWNDSPLAVLSGTDANSAGLTIASPSRKSSNTRHIHRFFSSRQKYLHPGPSRLPNYRLFQICDVC